MPFDTISRRSFLGTSAAVSAAVAHRIGGFRSIIVPLPDLRPRRGHPDRGEADWKCCFGLCHGYDDIIADTDIFPVDGPGRSPYLVRGFVAG